MTHTYEEWELNFDSAPFCNGSLHLGHVRNYVLGDVRARWLRKHGVNVTYLSAFDAFGLPNEEGAREAGIQPDNYVSSQAERISRQMRALGLSYSRRPLPHYCDPSYYKWTQWLFLRLWKSGLIYRKEQDLPYCPACDSFLANTQIQNGLCWRCEGNIIARSSEQWFVKTSTYMDRLYHGIDDLTSWSNRARNILRSFMGRLDGTCSNLVMNVAGQQFKIRLFSETVPGGVQSQVAIGLRSDHALAVFLRSVDQRFSDPSVAQRARRTADRSEKKPRFCMSLDGLTIPVYFYSPGDIPTGIDALSIHDPAVGERCAEPPIEARVVHTQPRVVYRTQDWLVSRNRDWGTPLPAVDCSACGLSPVAEIDLPVRLSVHGGNGHARCSSCGTLQRIVPRVLDCFFDDSWCFFATSSATSPARSASVNPFEAWRQLPPSRVHFHAGYDTFVYLHVFRFVGYALYDLGYTPHPEPITFYHGHDVVTAEGRKMSKKHRNAPNLDDLLERWGCDVVRLSVLVNANPGKTMSWSENRLRHSESLLATVRHLGQFMRKPRSIACQPDAPSILKTLRRIKARLHRVDRFIEEYRIGAAVDQLYLATQETIRIAKANDSEDVLKLCDELLSWWQLFAPESQTIHVPEKLLEPDI